MFDKELLLKIIDENISKRHELHAELQEINSFSKDEDDSFCAKTDEILKLRKHIAEDEFVEKNSYLQIAADFDNYKKRVIREKTDIINSANKDIIKDFLSIVDNMERLLQMDSNPGYSLIYNEMIKLLDAEGCTKIKTEVGEPFDVNFHEAISVRPIEENENIESGCIVAIYSSGWTLNGKLLRPTKVIVGK